MAKPTKGGHAKSTVMANEIESLYLDFLRAFYEDGDRQQAQAIGQRLEAAMAARPDFADSIRAEEIHSLLAELRSDWAQSIRHRQAEIRKILELHGVSNNTPSWSQVIKQYDFSDVADRLDLLAMLYDRQGDQAGALATLRESKRYCESHSIPFDGKDLLNELEQIGSVGKNGATMKRAKRRKTTPRKARSTS